MEVWIPVTLAAATFQILRTSMQHRLRQVLSVNSVGYVRYVFGFPLALVASFVTFVVLGADWPDIPARFWPIIAGAGMAQILGTLALLRSFDLRDFAIGTVYAKTEVVLVALVSAAALGEPLAGPGWVGVVVCLVGVAWLAAPGKLRTVLSSAADPAAGMGVAAAGAFAVAAVGIRAASTSLDDAGTVPRALLTLTVMLGIQTLLNGVQLAVSTPDALRSVWTHRRRALPVGILSLCGSAGWAIAVTLTSAAKVRTLGQVELVIAFAISVLVLRERHGVTEYAASGLVLVGVGLVVAVG